MTTDDTQDNDTNFDRLSRNLLKIDELSKRLIAAMAQREPSEPSLQGPGEDLMMKTTAAYMSEMMSNPSKILEHQIAYWGNTLKHYLDAQQVLKSGKLAAPEDQTPADRRFSNPLWSTHPYFNYIKQQYLMSAAAIKEAVEAMEGLDETDKQRARFFSQQMVDMFAPTNFLGTNPDALARAAETDGQSLVDGLTNLVHDIEAHNGEFLVSLADETAFEVGKNIAASEGAVVYRNRMFELIQYAPQTETVHATPLIIFPPWINKFYVMDLKPQNSLIRWVVEQGYTLFIVSWVNPDPSYRDVSIDTYIEEGFLTAIEEVKKITKQPQVNAAGYCIAGTTLSLTLALMKKRGDKSVKSATFFTALTDFSDQGEFTVFLTDDFVDGIEREVNDKGILGSYLMSRTFSFLRSNDLIYGPAIRSYMMGQAPPAFDLLFWNGDGANLPARMTVQYLRDLCQDNLFAKGDIEICGEHLSIKDVSVPVCAIACETDHIAAWKSSFNGIKQFSSRSKTFILSESGHIAGIINPPSKKKYGHYTNDGPMREADAWLEGASFHEGSWWPRWEEWLSGRSGKQVPARKLGENGQYLLAQAPGTYVVAKPSD